MRRPGTSKSSPVWVGKEIDHQVGLRTAKRGDWGINRFDENTFVSDLSMQQEKDVSNGFLRLVKTVEQQE